MSPSPSETQPFLNNPEITGTRRAILCFVHLERAAGTTLHYIFRQNAPLSYLTLTAWHYWSNDDRGALSAAEFGRLVRWLPFVTGVGGHTTRSYLGYAEAAGRPVVYTTFLRDPVARYLSHWNYQRERMGVPWSLERFTAERRFDNYMTRRIAGAPDLELAKRRLVEFAFVGLAERFDESLLLMRQALGLPEMNVLYERRNASRDPAFRQTSALDDPVMSKTMQSNNALDIELYAFARDQIYPRQVDAYGPRLDVDLEDHRGRLDGFRFSRARKCLWGVWRYLGYRNLEWWLRKRYGHRGRDTRQV